MKMAMQLVADNSRRSGKSVSVVSCHTLKPLDVEGIARGAGQPQPCHRHRGARAAGRPGAAHQADRLGQPGQLPPRYVHAAGCLHPQLWQPRRPAGRARPRARRHLSWGWPDMNATSAAASLKAPRKAAPLAIHGGEPVRKTPMPPRLALGDAEAAMVNRVLEHYRQRQVDPGYQGVFEKRYTDLFVEMMGGGYADAVATGTASLYVALAALDLPKGSEVLVSPITDPGSLAAIVLNGLKPRLMDSMPGSYNVGPEEFARAHHARGDGRPGRARGGPGGPGRQDRRDRACAGHQGAGGLRAGALCQAARAAGRHLRRHRRLLHHVPQGAHDRAVGGHRLRARPRGLPPRHGACRPRQAALARGLQ